MPDVRRDFQLRTLRVVTLCSPAARDSSEHLPALGCQMAQMTHTQRFLDIPVRVLVQDTSH